jgi:transposase-like protein
MAINPTNSFEERHFPCEVIVLCVCWYLRYLLAHDWRAAKRASIPVERGMTS